MAEAAAEDTLQWVLLREEAVRLAERSARDLKPLAAAAVERRFRSGGYDYRYRDAGVLHENDLSAEVLRAAVIDIAGSTAVARVPNPDLPYARADCLTPKPQWIPDGPYAQDPFLRPAYIEKTLTDIEVLVLRQVMREAPRPGRPSSAELVLAEAKRQLQGSDSRAHHIRQGRKKFLAWLSDWLHKTHPEAGPMKDKTIGDHLRENEEVRALLPKSWLRRR